MMKIHAMCTCGVQCTNLGPSSSLIHIDKCNLCRASSDLLEACQQAFDCLTENDTLESQSHHESPYHFLYAAIMKAVPDA